MFRGFSQNSEADDPGFKSRSYLPLEEGAKDSVA
jgi:hypothetical protein